MKKTWGEKNHTTFICWMSEKSTYRTLKWLPGCPGFCLCSWLPGPRLGSMVLGRVSSWRRRLWFLIEALPSTGPNICLHEPRQVPFQAHHICEFRPLYFICTKIHHFGELKRFNTYNMYLQAVIFTPVKTNTHLFCSWFLVQLIHKHYIG